jgi:hypothetical protein
MGGGKDVASARERVLSSMYGARERLFLPIRALFCPAGQKSAPERFFLFRKNGP